MAYKVEDFHVGQRVRIREWDYMAEEFGIGYSSGIDCMYQFIPDMKPLCGTEVTITYIDCEPFDGRGEVKFKETAQFAFSTDMIEPVNVLNAHGFDIATFNAMLGIEEVHYESE